MNSPTLREILNSTIEQDPEVGRLLGIMDNENAKIAALQSRLEGLVREEQIADNLATIYWENNLCGSVLDIADHIAYRRLPHVLLMQIYECDEHGNRIRLIDTHLEKHLAGCHSCRAEAEGVGQVLALAVILLILLGWRRSGAYDFFNKCEHYYRRCNI